MIRLDLAFFFLIKYDFIAEQVLDQCVKDGLVVRPLNLTRVVDLAIEVFECPDVLFQLFRLRLLDEVDQLSIADLVITVVELVRHLEANRSIGDATSHDRVQVCQTEEDVLVSDRVLGRLAEGPPVLLVQDHALDALLDRGRRLQGDLN
jgi:hypothetical protein